MRNNRGCANRWAEHFPRRAEQKMTDFNSDLTPRVPSADEIARIVARSRKLRDEAIREMLRSVWARVTGRHGALKAHIGTARHA